MENLPAEVLEMIFKELCSLQDIQHCYKTCSKWQNIIHKMFQAKAKVLVVKGRDSPHHLDETCEIINMIDTTMPNSIFQEDIARAVICAKSVAPSVDVLLQIALKPMDPLEGDIGLAQYQYQPGRFHYNKGVLLDEKTLWFTGGAYSINNFINNRITELVTLNQPPRRGPDLPFLIHGHCMIKVNNQTIYIIGGMIMKQLNPELGGYRYPGYSTDSMLKATTDTWIVDPTKNFEIRKGPKLKVARYGHSCNTMKINGKLHVVVAGGETGRFTPKRNYKILNSVELLDPTSPNERSFDLGPRLPFRLTRATMMTSITGKSVIIIGGSKTNGFDDNSVNNTLLELSGNSKDSLKWTVLEQKLQFSRKDPVCFTIPNEIARELTSPNKSNQ